MKYGIFKRTLGGSAGAKTITFTSLQNLANNSQPLVIEADYTPTAAEMALQLLKLSGLMTHSIDGNTNTIMGEFPNYFVGQFAVDLADKYDTESLMYQIETFTPVPKK